MPYVADIADMVGKVFTKIYNSDDTQLIFENDTERYIFEHVQECCESVLIDDIVGDLQDLVGVPLLIAESVDGQSPAEFDGYSHDCYEWTFYKYATIKGYVDIRWFGESNGYYSTYVSLHHELK